MDKNTRQIIITWFLLIVLVAMSLTNLALYINKKQSTHPDFRSIVQEELQKELARLDLKDGYTPVKGIDYVDGLNGRNGKNGKDGANGTNGVDGRDGVDGKDGVEGKPGAPGRTLEQRCNSRRLRIEAKYTDSETWEVLYYLPEGAKCGKVE